MSAALDIIDRLKFDATRCELQFSKGVAGNINEAAAEIERLRAALRYFVGCAYPVATEINPRGHAWRGEDSLDFALGEAKMALRADEQNASTGERRDV